jgi:hypothetical protein
MSLESNPSSTQTRQVVIAAVGVTAIVAYKLFDVASQTGNYEGMWFSLFHTVLVAVGVVLALRTAPDSRKGV